MPILKQEEIAQIEEQVDEISKLWTLSVVQES